MYLLRLVVQSIEDFFIPVLVKPKLLRHRLAVEGRETLVGDTTESGNQVYGRTKLLERDNVAKVLTICPFRSLEEMH